MTFSTYRRLRSIGIGALVGLVLGATLVVLIPGPYSLGQQLKASEDLNDAKGLVAGMMVLFIVGVVVDAFVFSYADRAVRRRYGLIDQAAAA